MNVVVDHGIQSVAPRRPKEHFIFVPQLLVWLQ
jgi:hypothetical protein